MSSIIFIVSLEMDDDEDGRSPASRSLAIRLFSDLEEFVARLTEPSFEVSYSNAGCARNNDSKWVHELMGTGDESDDFINTWQHNKILSTKPQYLRNSIVYNIKLNLRLEIHSERNIHFETTNKIVIYDSSWVRWTISSVTKLFFVALFRSSPLKVRLSRILYLAHKMSARVLAVNHIWRYVLNSGSFTACAVEDQISRPSD